MIDRESAFDYPSTMARLISAISKRGLTIFCRVDHAAGAREAGLELPPEEVVLFGNPRAGTPLMQASPAVGYELPLRVAVWQQGAVVHVAYRDPREFAELFGLETARPALEQMAALLSTVAAEASTAS